MLPDLNPSGLALLFYNRSLIAEGAFVASLFGQALAAVGLGSTQASQVNVPQFIGQGKVYYRLPNRLDSGLLIYCATYRDYTTPSLNGILRSYTICFGHSW
jgi:hypothetical protein